LILSGNTSYGTAETGGTGGGNFSSGGLNAELYGNGTVFSLSLPVPPCLSISNTARKPLWQAAFSPSEHTKKYAKKCNGLE